MSSAWTPAASVCRLLVVSLLVVALMLFGVAFVSPEFPYPGQAVVEKLFADPNQVDDVLTQGTCREGHTSSESAKVKAIEPYIGDHIATDDPGLVKTIRRHFIDLPRPYIQKLSRPLMQTPQAKEVDRILKQKENGFFVECGALDGERSSNSIWLEHKRNWNGLLVEMDPSYYLQIRGKNRKCYSINGCLSPQTYPVQMQLLEHAMGEGRLVMDGGRRKESGLGSLSEADKARLLDSYCFPLYSLMLSLNRTRIDYFSLDVEDNEMPILRTIPFDKLDIAVLTVEYTHGKNKSDYINFMKTKGYTMVKDLVFDFPQIYLGGRDFVFVREDLI